MSDLWNPNKYDRRGISAGERKVKLGYLRPILEAIDCPFCANPILKRTDNGKLLTLGGSNHHCKKMDKLS
jgi:hypothetical protein